MRHLTPGKIAVIALGTILFFLTVFPLLTLLFGSFVKEGPLASTTTFTLDGYRAAYLRPEVIKTLWTTLWLTAIRTALCIAVGVFLAWVVTRTDTPWRRFIELSVWVSLFIPLQPMVFAWIALLSKKIGLINLALRSVFPLGEEGPFNIYSYGGIIWVSMLLWSAGAFILVTPSFKRMDPALEEAARMGGGNRWEVFRRITLPLMKPAIVGATILTFVRLVGSFEIEVFLGFPARIFVFTTKVYDYLNYSPARYVEAMAMTSIIQIITLALIFMQWRMLGRTQYTVISGSGLLPRLMALGPWKYVTLALALLYVMITLVIPFLVLAGGAFMKVFGVFRLDLLTLENYRIVIADIPFWSSLKNTMVVGGAAATVGMVFYALISYVIVRPTFTSFLRRYLDLLSFLPYSIPPMALALGVLWAFIGVMPFGRFLYGSLFLMVIVGLIRPLPLGVTAMKASLLQLGNEMEESSRVSGASWGYTFRRIVAPLVAPAFVVTWIMIFLGVWRDLVTFILIYKAGSRLAAIRMFEYWESGVVEASVAMGVIMVVIAFGLAILALWLGAKAEGVTGEAR